MNDTRGRKKESCSTDQEILSKFLLVCWWLSRKSLQGLSKGRCHAQAYVYSNTYKIALLSSSMRHKSTLSSRHRDTSSSTRLQIEQFPAHITGYTGTVYTNTVLLCLIKLGASVDDLIWIWEWLTIRTRAVWDLCKISLCIDLPLFSDKIRLLWQISPVVLPCSGLQISIDFRIWLGSTIHRNS